MQSKANAREVEKQDTSVNVCMPRELRIRLEKLQAARLGARGHRLSLSDLAREAIFLLLEREETTKGHPNGLPGIVLEGMAAIAVGPAA